MNRFTDPRPHLADSPLWTSLFRGTAHLTDRQRAKELYFHLWSFRYHGAIIQRTSATDMKLYPIYLPDGHWLNEWEFEEMKEKFLKPYAKELNALIQRLEA